MAGLLDGYTGDDTTKDEFGQTQADRRQPIWSGLINAGLLAVAGGQNLMPAERAKYIAQAGGAIGGIGPEMIQARSAAAQQALRAQEIKGKQADVAQQAQWRAYANSPDFAKAMDAANATPAERMAAQAAAMKGDFKTVATVLDPRRNDPKVSGQMITAPGGWVGRVSDLTGELTWIMRGSGPEPKVGGGGGGTPTPTTPTPTTPQPPAVPPDASSPDINARTRAADQEIAGFQTYGTPQQPQPTATTPQPTTPDLRAVTGEAGATLPSAFNQNDPSMPGWNKAAFDALPPRLQPLVAEIGRYQRPMPAMSRGAGTMGLKAQDIMDLNQKVLQVYPGYKPNLQPQVTDAIKAYGANGKMGENIYNWNVLHGHANELYDAINKLNPGSSQYLNEARNYALTKTGNADPTVAQLLTSVVGGEAMKSISNHVTDSEKAAWDKPLSTFNSKAQWQGVLNSVIDLVNVRDREAVNRWNTSTQGTMPVKSFISPANQAFQQHMRDNPLGGKPASSYAGPDGKPVSAVDITATAKKYNKSEADVIRDLSLKPVQ